MARRPCLAFVGAVAWTLSGCGNAPPPTPAPGPGPLELPKVSYIYIAAPNASNPGDNSGIETILANGPDSTCDAQGWSADGSGRAYEQVSKECCRKAAWDTRGYAANTFELPISTMYQGVDYSCPIIALSPTQYVRGWAGCQNDGDNNPMAMWAEGCTVPEEADNWPMPDAQTADKYWSRGSYDDCNCRSPKTNTSRFRGSECYVGRSFPGFAYFYLVEVGDCSTQAQVV